MNESAGVRSLTDYDDALHREARLIAARFPRVSQAEAELRLRDQFSRLARHATVQSHLVTVAGAALTSALRAEGFTFATPATSGASELET